MDRLATILNNRISRQVSPILFFMTAKFLVFADYLVDFSLSIFRVLDQVIENTNQCQFRNVITIELGDIERLDSEQP